MFLVFIKTNDGGIDKVVIPVRGFGLWGTLYGYLALESDLSTLAGLGSISTKKPLDWAARLIIPKWKQGWQGVQFVRSRRPACSGSSEAALAGQLGDVAL